MKTFLDMVGKQTPEGNTPLELGSDLMIRTMEPSESLTAKLLSAQASDAREDKCGITDPLLRGLVDRLPKPDGIWPLDDRAKWLRTAADIFDLVYKAGDGEAATGLGVAEGKEGRSPGEERTKNLFRKLHQ